MITGFVITTYNLGDAHSHQNLAADLRLHGFDVELDETQEHDAYLTVTHEADEAGRLDERVYAAAPSADIIETVRPDRPAVSDPSRALPQPRHGSARR